MSGRFFEIDGREKEGERWWASMLGLFVEEPMFFWGDFFGAGGDVGAMLLHLWVIE